jgi:hypothetical protein
MHVSPAAHARPQAPQFDGSVVMSAHASPHGCVGAAQTHVPPKQTALLPHA